MAVRDYWVAGWNDYMLGRDDDCGYVRMVSAYDEGFLTASERADYFRGRRDAREEYDYTNDQRELNHERLLETLVRNDYARRVQLTKQGFEA